MFEHIIEALLIVALTSFGGYLFGTYRATHGAFVTMQHGLQALLRSSMLDAYDKFTRLGGCTVTDSKILITCTSAITAWGLMAS